MTLKMHVDDDDKLTRQIVVSGQHRRVIFLNESGLRLTKVRTEKTGNMVSTWKNDPSLRFSTVVDNGGNMMMVGCEERKVRSCFFKKISFVLFGGFENNEYLCNVILNIDSIYE